jgi:muramoyltetrapeptide carboxypeptidase LdcA involved in peptidoglycan recycling
MLKPKPLKEGDTVAVLSPSWGGPSVFPDVYELGLENLKSCLGVKVKELPTTRSSADYLYMNPRERAQDVNHAFADAEIDAIITSIGGEDSVRILPYLKNEVIRKNPKIFMGFSDTTTLLSYINQLGLVTFHGPSVMAGFCQLQNLPQSYGRHLKEMLMIGQEEFRYSAYETYSNAEPRWGTTVEVGLVDEPQDNPDAWRWLRGSESVKGQLFGGCIEVLEFLKGTEFWPPKQFWDDKILFFETSEERPSIDQVKWMLRNYGMQGIFDQINGLIFGRARDYSDEEKRELDEMILSVVEGEFSNSKLTIVTNMDFGHTYPQFILPLGTEAEIDPSEHSFKLIERPLSS